MPFMPNILIGNTNVYQLVNFQDALTGEIETGVELFISLCLAPPSGNNQYITNATNTSPIVITSNGHGLVTNDVVTIVNVGGNGAAKGTFTVTVIDANTFSLNGSAGGGAYDGGGQWFQCVEGASAIAMTDGGDGSYTAEIDGTIPLIPNQTYVLVYYCLGAYRDIFNDVVRIVAQVRGMN